VQRKEIEKQTVAGKLYVNTVEERREQSVLQCVAQEMK
jgi:hypothetical protein